jgi:fatty-acyl-CoA synthase
MSRRVSRTRRLMLALFLNLAPAAFRDGWYRTGDLGRLDNEGYLHILGRAVDITWSDGVMINPTLIQDTLCRVPGVRYAVIVTDPEAAARVAAVVPWPGSAGSFG